MRAEQTQICPFCERVVRLEAVKCRHCKETLDRRALDRARKAAAAPGGPGHLRHALRRPGTWLGAVMFMVLSIIGYRLITDETNAVHVLGLYQGMPCERFARRLMDGHRRYLALVRYHRLPAGPEYRTRMSLADGCRLATESHIKNLGFLTKGGTALNLIWVSDNDEKLESWSLDVSTWTSVSGDQRRQFALIKGKLIQGKDIGEDLFGERASLLAEATRSFQAMLHTAPCNSSKRKRRFWVVDAGVAWTRCSHTSLVTVQSVHHLLDHSLNKQSLSTLRERLRWMLRREGLME